MEFKDECAVTDRFVAELVATRIENFFELTGRKWPNERESFTFLVEEIGELARAINNVLSDGWVRNNPENNVQEFGDLLDELGDVIMMAMVTARAFDDNALDRMLAKINRKTDAQIDDVLDRIESAVERTQKVADALVAQNLDEYAELMNGPNQSLDPASIAAVIENAECEINLELRKRQCQLVNSSDWPDCDICDGTGFDTIGEPCEECIGFGSALPECRREVHYADDTDIVFKCETPLTRCDHRCRNEYGEFCLHPSANITELNPYTADVERNRTSGQ